MQDDENKKDADLKEMILDLFYSTKGNLDAVNAALDAKFKITGERSISLFEKFIRSRLDMNPKTLRMANLEITPVEAVYLSQYPGLEGVEVLDLRKNSIGYTGLDALAHSTLLTSLRELDLRNNGITRIGMESLAKTQVLTQLEKLDLRMNKLGKRWETKLIETHRFPVLRELKVG